MKKLSTILTMVAMAIAAYSQAPQKLSYQAVIRNSGGQLVTNHAVGMKISILQGSATGTVVYSETYSPVPQTNVNGLVSIEIGGGNPGTGTFSTINWGSGTYYLKVEADPAGGTSYTVVGTSQLISVPYALHAKNAASYTETDPVFGAAPAKAITSELITNWNTAYGWGNHAGLYKLVSYVPAWSEVTGKPTSVGGYGITDAVTLSGDQNITGKKTFNSDILVNTLTVGIGSGNSTNNTSFGYHALFNNLTGGGNTANGYGALGSNTGGDYNTAVGLNALVLNKTGRYNIGIGYLALRNNFSGEDNTAIGNNALYTNVIGAGNVAIGNGALYKSIGSGSTVIGYNAGYNNSGTNNVLLGYMAGYWETGSNKLFIDNQKRASESDARVKALIYGVFDASPANQSLTINGNATVTGNLQVGNSFGPITSNWWEFGTDSNNGTGIDFHCNTSPTDYSARIYRTPGNDGEFQVVNNGSGPLVLYTSGGLRIVGLTSSPAGAPLIISGGNVYFMGSTRDIKDNIQPLNDDFTKILNANPVSFTDKNTGMKGIGYIAEEFEDAGLQNLLVYENGKLVSLRYDLISVYNLEIIKKLQKQIESMEEENQILRSEVSELRADFNRLDGKQRSGGKKQSRQ